MPSLVPAKNEMSNPKLLDEVRRVLRFKHNSLRTEEAYLDWIRRFIVFHGKRHPREMGAAEVKAFLTHLATERNVGPSTENQALSEIRFLYQHVLEVALGWIDGVGRAKKLQRRFLQHVLPKGFHRARRRKPWRRIASYGRASL